MPDRRRIDFSKAKDNSRTMISISVKNKKRLGAIGNMYSTYEDVIEKILDFYETQHK